tara:strand:- start:519 stop:779 length:261 start_codon:yes stop_codon:yes gene_type:complete
MKEKDEIVNERTCAKCDGSLERAMSLGIVNFCKECLDKEYVEWISIKQEEGNGGRHGFFIGFRKRDWSGVKKKKHDPFPPRQEYLN